MTKSEIANIILERIVGLLAVGYNNNQTET
jgi:hypothetical protein